MDSIGKKVRENFEDTVKLKKTEQLPVAIWGGAPFINSFAGISIREYFTNTDMKIKATEIVQKSFPETIMLPGFYSYFGTTVEASALGCEIIWQDDGPPWVKHILASINSVYKIKPIDPFVDGLMPEVLEEYKVMWDKIDPIYIEDYGYLDGIAHCMGPLQIASMVRGHSELFIDFYDSPKEVHKLLEIITDTLITWLHAIETVNGRLKRLCLADHIPAQISKDQFEEFCFPYLKKVFDEFTGAIKLYHNEDNVLHVLNRIPDTGADIFHFGDLDLKLTKEMIGGKICLMGNIHPIKTLLQGNCQQVAVEVLNCIKEFTLNGGFILSSGGGMAPGTKKENIQTMIDVAMNNDLTSIAGG